MSLTEQQLHASPSEHTACSSSSSTSTSSSRWLNNCSPSLGQQLHALGGGVVHGGAPAVLRPAVVLVALVLLGQRIEVVALVRQGSSQRAGQVEGLVRQGLSHSRAAGMNRGSWNGRLPGRQRAAAHATATDANGCAHSSLQPFRLWVCQLHKIQSVSHPCGGQAAPCSAHKSALTRRGIMQAAAVRYTPARPCPTHLRNKQLTDQPMTSPPFISVA